MILGLPIFLLKIPLERWLERKWDDLKRERMFVVSLIIFYYWKWYSRRGKIGFNFGLFYTIAEEELL